MCFLRVNLLDGWAIAAPTPNRLIHSYLILKLIFGARISRLDDPMYLILVCLE